MPVIRAVNLGNTLRHTKASAKGTTSTVVTLRSTMHEAARKPTSAPRSTIGKNRGIMMLVTTLAMMV